MQNYRSNTMNYSTYRQPAVPLPAPKDTLENMPLAMAYVPWQKWQNIYDVEKGLCNGTIFQDLNLPFLGMGGYQK